MKSALRIGVDLTARCAVMSGFVGLLERLGDRNSRILRVLTYHRVDDPATQSDLYPNLISATPDEFAWQVSYLSDHYRVVSMAEVFDSLVRGVSLPPKPVLITFDDGYQDFAKHAWPILRSHGLPVTLFVPTGFPDQPQRTFWWDRLHAAIQFSKYDFVESPIGRIELATCAQRIEAMRKLVSLVKSLPDDEALQWIDRIRGDLGSPPANNSVLSWESLRQLAEDGVTLAPHTRLHPLLNRVDLERAREEVAGSLIDLQRKISDVLPVFAYPSGAYTRQVVEMLPSLGIKLAFTTCRGLNDLSQIDRLRIRRINIGSRTSHALLRTQLLPWSVHLNRLAPLPDAVNV